MIGLQALVGSRSSFVLAALALSWLGIVLLALIAANLHFRLAHVERSQPASENRAPFGHLLGRNLVEVLGSRVAPSTRLAFVLASDCSSCERILAELGERHSGAGVVVLWRDAHPPFPSPPGVTVLDNGPEVSRELGVRVVPFALSADASGRIVRAGPVGSVKVLADLLSDAGLDGRLIREAAPVPQQP